MAGMLSCSHLQLPARIETCQARTVHPGVFAYQRDVILLGDCNLSYVARNVFQGDAIYLVATI